MQWGYAHLGCACSGTVRIWSVGSLELSMQLECAHMGCAYSQTLHTRSPHAAGLCTWECACSRTWFTWGVRAMGLSTLEMRTQY
jgi:hypothetical protein